MQVLNSPSREEVNAAHFAGSWMGIGIPSVRNAFRVSRFKTACWLCLLISSIPIHLLFNSTVFQTDRRESDFHMTIATEEFVNGGPFYPPGQSLVQGGFTSFFNTTQYGDILDSEYFYYDPTGQTPYGDAVNLTDYADKDSSAVKNISATASKAGRWTKLDAEECKQEYVNCNGLKEHRSLVMVINKPGGWIRNDMWHLLDNQTEYWARYVPPDQPNHLFFSAQCQMYAQRIFDRPTECENTCSAALGVSYNDDGENLLLLTQDWEFPFFNSNWEVQVNGTDTSVYHMLDGSPDSTYFSGSLFTSGLQPMTYNMSVQYCLAEPLERVCHIALSPTLLLAVTLCVIFKTVTAILVTVVLSRRNQAPLVTLGDAMESFIEKPDRITAGMCTIGQTEIRRAMRVRKAFLVPGPRQWQPLRRRRAAVIPWSVWLTSYLLFGIGISVCAYFYDQVSRNDIFGSFFESDQNAFLDMTFTFAEGVLLANSPQILLSICYLAYNNMFTRLQMAREWSLFSESYQGLRVTDPKGDQYSTYRLQLPYKYSIPLIAISIFLHWLLSNTIYLFVSLGGYYGTTGFISGDLVDPSLPPNTAIAVGYSGKSLLAMLVVSCVLITIPFILSFKRLPPNMVNIGSNSLAISAACHASVLSHAVKSRVDSLMVDSPFSSKLELPQTPRSPERLRTLLPGERFTDDPNGSSIEMQRLVTSSTRKSSHLSLASSSRLLLRRSEDSDSNMGDEQQISPFRKLARSKMRWGVVPMPPEWHAEHDNEDGVVEHLSFGVEEDDVKPPESGQYYA
ncbi:hypothetical protein F4821DRAFT_216117 [Hypoxylon rubiginosum]|uniref:Uncharacterized protein n=1 Tax=Hypoxylon rubiginosum TaxID=110542 RepID=A0ACC0CPT6_9PEZI|nr:hypothetical protein F4821DRAFT_216117 [Hypoxylon rubiginosum]